MNEYNLKESVERLVAAFGYMMSSYSDEESNIHPKFENLDDIAIILNDIFKESKCKEVIFTQNLDKMFFGVRVNPEITKSEIINIISTSDPVRFRKYSVEIDSKVLDAQLTPEELAVYILYEISSMIDSNEPIEKLRQYIDIYLTSADDVISIRDTVHYYQLIIYAIKDTLVKISSMIYKDTPEDLLNSNSLINSLELNDILIDAHQKIISSEYGPGDSMRAPNMVLLRWMFIMYRSMDTNSNVVKDSLKDAYSLTASKLERFEIEKTLNAIDHIDNSIAYIKEDGNLIDFLESANISIVNESLFGNLKRRGLRSLEDDLYTVQLQIKNLDTENEAIYTMRFINTRLNILEDYLYENQGISDAEKKHWNMVANKYRALREELVRKKIWKQKNYGLFWDYNQTFEGDPTDESTEVVDESVGFALVACLAATAWISIPFVIAGAIDKNVQKKYYKSLKNYEDAHKDDKDFIKVSNLETKTYSLKLMSNELDKEYKEDKPKNAFEKFLYNIKDKSIFRGSKYNNKAICFIKENKIYCYMIYNAEAAADSVKFFATSKEAKAHSAYYMVYACTKVGFCSTKTNEFVKAYKNPINESTEESADFFEDDVVEEGVIDNIKQKVTDLVELKKEWSKYSDKFVENKWIYRYIKDEKQYETLQKYYKMLTDDDTSYKDYKKGFKYIANFFGLPEKEIIIEWMQFEKDPKGNEPDKVSIRYSKGRHKVEIPSDVRLIHTSPVDNIQNLEPAFRSKTKGKFMYPTKRCFFTVGKAIDPFKAGNQGKKLYKYTTSADVGEAYIDPTYTKFKDGSIYIETEAPIPVMKFKAKMEQIFGKVKSKLPGGNKDKEEVKESVEESNYNDFDTFMESTDISKYDFKKFMSLCTQKFPEEYRKGISRFEEDEEEELDDFLDGHTKTLAVAYYDCRRVSRDSTVINNDIMPALRKFCKQMTEENDLFKLYISDAGGYDVFLDIKRKEVKHEYDTSWYDAEAMEICEAFDYDMEVLDEGALKDFIETIKNWKTSNNNHAKKVFDSTQITDEEFNDLQNIIKTLKDPDVKYSDYKVAFKKLCTYCHTIPDGTIITKYILKKGKEKDKNRLHVEYGENTKKMKLPEGVKLFHMSKVQGIKNLIPQFKGKSEMGYLYDKPRIYFTINKYMPKFLADYRKGEKVYKYEAKQDIQDVYVDPLVWNISQGAVYVDTTSPIPVEEVNPNIVKDAVDKVNPLKKNEEENKEDTENTEEK